VPESLSPVRWFGQQAVVSLPEHIDVSNAGQIREALLAVINRGAQALIADMTATISCDQAGAAAVVRAHQRAFTSGTQLRLVVTSEIVRRVLSISGIDRLVPMYPTLPASLAARAPEAGAQLTLVGEPAGVRAGRGREDRPWHVAGRFSGQPPDQPEPDVGVEVALLDRSGVIVSVNEAWQAFALANGGDPERVGRGVSYLDVCAAAGDDPVAAQVAAAIRGALAGDLPGPLAVEVPCHSPRTARWFHMLMSPRQDDSGTCLGVTITLSLARSRPLVGPSGSGEPLAAPAAGSRQGQPSAAQAARPEPGPPDLAWRLLDAFHDGLALADGNGRLVVVNRRLEDMFGYRRGELLGQPFESLIPADLQTARRGRRRASAQAARASGAGRQGAGDRLLAQRKDGSTFPAEISISPVTAASSRFALSVVRDLTAARRLENLADLAAATITAQQAHRSRELLDAIIARMYQVGLSLQEALDLPAEMRNERITAALAHLDETISLVRRTAFPRPGS